jgi:hypothetical protein
MFIGKRRQMYKTKIMKEKENVSPCKKKEKEKNIVKKERCTLNV